MKLNYHVLNESVVLNYDGKTKVVAASDERYEKVLNCIREKRLADIPEIIEAAERKFADKGLELRDGLLHVNNEPLPAELEQRILKFKEQKLPFEALLKFWDNLKNNPSYNSRQQLFKFLEHNGHPLTSDGCFIAYRGVREDFKDKHSGTFDNKPGSICEMPRAAVDDNPNNTCSRGLHVACFEYAKGFGEKLVEVKVNPADVVCVPVDYNGTKMRTCRFEVIQEVAEIATDELREFDENDCAGCGVHMDDCLCPCSSCGEPEEECLCDGLNSDDSPEEQEEETTELNGKGDDRQRRHAVRGPGGRFVSK